MKAEFFRSDAAPRVAKRQGTLPVCAIDHMRQVMLLSERHDRFGDEAYSFRKW